MEKVKTVVKIAGKEYLMAGYETEEYMHRVAIYVDRKIQALEQNYVNLSTAMLAVLAALNITDELMKLQDEIPAMQDKISQLKEEVRQLQKENMALKEGKNPILPNIKDGRRVYDGMK